MGSRLTGWTMLWLAATLSLGCAQHATFVHRRPAKVAAPIRRLAVLEMHPQREEGHEAAIALWAELEQSGRFELVRQQQLQAAAPAPLMMSDGSVDQNAAIHAGRLLGLDGLLIAKVRFMEIDGTLYGTKTVRIGDPSVFAAVQYELIDVQSGRILDRSIAKSETVHEELNDHISGQANESKILSRLAAEGGANVAHVLLPWEDEIQVKLAHSSFGPGSAAVRKGTSLARSGNWRDARQTWLQAVEENPRNDAAAYNLAVAHEALGEFGLARQALDVALGESQNSLYKEALQRVDRADAEWRFAQRAATPRFAKLPPVRPQPVSQPAGNQDSGRFPEAATQYYPASQNGTFWR